MEMFENNMMIVPRNELKLRKIGSKYMIVEVVDGCENLTKVYSLNETAAWLWEAICNAEKCTAGRLAEGLCAEYGIDADLARHDVEKQLAEWKEMGLIELIEDK